MNVDGLPVSKLAAAETERESAIEAILSDTKTAMTRATASLVLHMPTSWTHDPLILAVCRAADRAVDL